MRKKDITTEEKLAFCDQTITLKVETESKFLELGARLAKIRDEEMFAGRWENFDDYCESDLKMSPGTASKLINIHQKLVVEYKVSPGKLAEAGGWTRLAMALPFITDKKSADEWVDRVASAGSRRDLEMLIKEKHTGVDPIKCDHPEDQCRVIKICARCGESWRVYD
jgi:hypothetical protein